jgi:hypothetical protein
MGTERLKTMKMKRLGTMIALLLTVPFTVVTVAAQSQDRDNPERLRSNEISGMSTDNDRREFYYSFFADPGELTVTVDIATTSGGGYARVVVELFDEDSHPVASVNVLSIGPSNREVKRYKIAKRMPVLMRTTFDAGSGKYRVRLGGDVSFEQVTSPASERSDALHLPKTGILTITMRDGSIHTINLAEIRGVRID